MTDSSHVRPVDRPQVEWLKAVPVKEAAVQEKDGYIINWDHLSVTKIADLGDIDLIIQDGSLGGSDN